MDFTSVKKYIKEEFEDVIYDSAQKFFESHRYKVRQALEFKCHSDDLESDELNVMSVLIFENDNNKFGFDLVVTLSIMGTERCGWDVESISKDLWLNLICEGTIEEKFKDFKINSVRIYEADREKYSRPLNDRLAPFFHKNDLDKIAESFLNKYYPEALTHATSVDVRQVARNMGLKVCRHNIARDNSVFGRIFFEETIAKFYNSKTDKMDKIKVSANTIVYDPDAYFMDNIENENNNTIIHECIHYEYHRHAIEFQRIFNSKAKWIECNVDGNPGDSIIDISKLEWQANILAPRILMPYKTFSEKAKSLIDTFTQGNHCEVIDILPDVIDSLSKTFKVSKLSVKIRLCDIGINEAVGCNVWCDNSLVPTFSFDKGTCDYNETFVIPTVDAALLSLDSEIEELMNKHQLLYLDSHICFNDERYIGINPSGKPFIKHDARKHLNEFCIKMRMEIKEYNTLYKMECFLNHDKNSKVRTSLHFDGLMANMTDFGRIKAILKEESEFSKSFFELTNDFASCMKMLKERSNLTFEEISDMTHIEITSVKNIISGKRDGSLLRLTVILMALGADPDVAYHVIDKSGVRIDKATEEGLMCRFIINMMHADSMENIHKAIKAANLKI